MTFAGSASSTVRPRPGEDRAVGQVAVLGISMRLVVEHAPRQEVAVAATVAERVGVERRDGQRVRDHRVVDPVANAHEAEQDVVELLLGGHPRGAAGDRRHEVRELAAHDGDDAGRLGLHLESLEVVRDGDQVQLGRHVLRVRRVAEPAVGEDGELAALDERLELVLHGLEVRRSTCRPPAPARRCRRCWPRAPCAGST